MDEQQSHDRMLSRRAARIQRASWVGILGNGALAVLKVVAGVVSGSLAVISDGVDSGLDVLTSTITLVAAKIMAKPPDLGHPYGHSRAEAIATKSLAFVIFFAGSQLAIVTVGDLINGTVATLPSPLALYITGVSVLGKVGLAGHKFWVGKATKSPMLVADAKNMRSDIAISLAVLAGLGFTLGLDLPILDRITAIAVSVWIMLVAFRIYLDTNEELMEGHKDHETYRRIFDAVRSVDGVEHPHRARIRTVGAEKIIDLDIEVDGGLTVTEAHDIAKRTEAAIADAVEDVYDVIVHVEPVGNIETHERYGVSERKLANRSRDER